MPHLYTLNIRGEPVPCTDVLEWARWFETADRRVAEDFIEGTRISTVFLAIDHAWGGGKPALWETMVFRGKEWNEWAQRFFAQEHDCMRHTSREDAVAYHEAYAARLRKALDQAKAN